MNILRRGEKPNPYPWIGNYLCAYCSSILEMTTEDASDIEDWGEDQREGYWVKIRCPVCEQTRTLAQWDMTADHDRRRVTFPRQARGLVAGQDIRGGEPFRLDPDGKIRHTHGADDTAGWAYQSVRTGETLYYYKFTGDRSYDAAARKMIPR